MVNFMAPGSENFLLHNAWLIPALAFSVFAAVGLVARPLSNWVAGLAATAGAF